MNSKRNFDRRTIIGATLAIGASGLMWQFSNAEAEGVSGLYENIPLEDEVMGNENATATLLEYASMTCPHCKAFHETIMPSIKKKYIDTGKVKYIMRPFPFEGDRRGEAAFMLAKCAPSNKYYSMIDALFSSQQVWGKTGNPVPEMLRITKLSGMSEKEFNSCINDQELLKKITTGRNLAARKFAVRSTPTVFINNQRYTKPKTVKDLSDALDLLIGS